MRVKVNLNHLSRKGMFTVTVRDHLITCRNLSIAFQTTPLARQLDEDAG